MQLVLDTNEYLFTFGPSPEKYSQELLELIASEPEIYRLRISRTIVEEIRRNVAPQDFKKIWAFLDALEIRVDEDWEIPFELGAKYEALGLKRGDAFIAAYTEWAGAKHLITENRDFMALHRLAFEVIRAEKFLAQHK